MRRSISAVILIGATLATARPCLAGDATRYPLLSGYTMTSWALTDGIPTGPVYALAQDREGYLWLGTTNGVMRFDGARFTRWEAIYSTPLPRADVHAVSAARDGTLWVGFDRIDGGDTVAALRHGKVNSTAKGDAPQEAVTSILEDHTGVVWAVSNGALYRLRQNRWDVVRDRALGHEVVSVREDARSGLWIGTRQGVFRTRDGRSFELVAEGIARETSESADGTLWMTDPTHGVRRHGPQTPVTGIDAWGNRLLHDSRGNLWVGTTGQGLWRIRGTGTTGVPSIELATMQTGLSSNAIQSLLEDRDGNIWVGTMLGLHSLTPQQLTPLAAATLVRAVLPDADGSVWVGTASGLLRFRRDAGTWREQRVGSSLDIRSLSRDASGDAWATTDRGWYVVTRDRLILSQRHPENAPPCPAGTPRDLARASPDSVNQRAAIAPTANTATLPVWRPVCAAHDVVWASMERGSATLRRAENTIATIHAFPSSGTTGQASVDALFEDAQGAAWVGGTGGLWRIRDGTVEHRGERDGLPAQRVMAITQSLDGFLWLAVDRGVLHPGRRAALVRLHSSDFDRAIRTNAPLSGYRIYDIVNGLAGTPLGSAAAERSTDGSLWFAIGGSLTLVDPTQVAREQRRPEAPARIVGATIDERPVTTADTNVLPAGTRKLQIDYTALRLTSPRQTRFRYRLEGFDREWVDAGSRRQAYYTNLAPGQYVFHVQANHDGGTWSVPEALWPFTLQPAFRQTMWFYALCGTALLLVVWSAAQTRVWVLNRQFRATLAERARLSREIHDTMLQSLVGVALQVQAIARQCGVHASEQQSQLVSLRRQVEQHIREARQAIQNLRSTLLDTGDLAGALREIGRRTAIAPTRFDVSADQVVRASSSVEGELLRIAQEGVTNAARHAGAARIHVELRQESNVIRLRVTDDGRGFDVAAMLSADAGHFGLTGMQERAERIGGRLTITSSAEGTALEATVPCGRRA